MRIFNGLQKIFTSSSPLSGDGTADHINIHLNRFNASLRGQMFRNLAGITDSETFYTMQQLLQNQRPTSSENNLSVAVKVLEEALSKDPQADITIKYLTSRTREPQGECGQFSQEVVEAAIKIRDYALNQPEFTGGFLYGGNCIEDVLELLNKKELDHGVRTIREPIFRKVFGFTELFRVSAPHDEVVRQHIKDAISFLEIEEEQNLKIATSLRELPDDIPIQSVAGKGGMYIPELKTIYIPSGTDFLKAFLMANSVYPYTVKEAKKTRLAQIINKFPSPIRNYIDNNFRAVSQSSLIGHELTHFRQDIQSNDKKTSIQQAWQEQFLKAVEANSNFDNKKSSSSFKEYLLDPCEVEARIEGASFAMLGHIKILLDADSVTPGNAGQLRASITAIRDSVRELTLNKWLLELEELKKRGGSKKEIDILEKELKSFIVNDNSSSALQLKIYYSLLEKKQS